MCGSGIGLSFCVDSGQKDIIDGYFLCFKHRRWMISCEDMLAVYLFTVYEVLEDFISIAVGSGRIYP